MRIGYAIRRGRQPQLKDVATVAGTALSNVKQLQAIPQKRDPQPEEDRCVELHQLQKKWPDPGADIFYPNSVDRNSHLESYDGPNYRDEYEYVDVGSGTPRSVWALHPGVDPQKKMMMGYPLLGGTPAPPT